MNRYLLQPSRENFVQQRPMGSEQEAVTRHPHAFIQPDTYAPFGIKAAFSETDERLVLDTGDIVYIDCGTLTEWCTREGNGALEALYHERRLRKLMAAVAIDLGQSLYCRTAGYSDGQYNSLGYHLNACSVRIPERQKELYAVFESFLATSPPLYGAGIITPNGPAFCQKALSVGSGRKDMLSTQIGDGTVPEGFQRNEITCLDALTSALQAFVRNTDITLLLTYLEYGGKIDDDYLLLETPKQNYLAASQDVSLSRFYKTTSGKTIKLIDHQYLWLDRLKSVASNLDIGPHNRLGLNQRERLMGILASWAPEPDINNRNYGETPTCFDWAARFAYVCKKCNLDLTQLKYKQGSNKSANAAAKDIHWDTLAPNPVSAHYWGSRKILSRQCETGILPRLLHPDHILRPEDISRNRGDWRGECVRQFGYNICELSWGNLLLFDQGSLENLNPYDPTL
jgi:hypothetical protein